jgi:hypothetical protein
MVVEAIFYLKISDLVFSLVFVVSLVIFKVFEVPLVSALLLFKVLDLFILSFMRYFMHAKYNTKVFPGQNIANLIKFRSFFD